ncbi:MAG: metalloregulator ArsR/SmtB family transcription factor [Chloroflexi bacterium]|nr:metalloregulator ArsR/SmtB family transcription factor [Chloroflexota bacterium]MCI0575547.1 metalloregulator ArsR/SmtB family transcription factor [Chloroflexota bacterium]MCI0644087.1 metalloregulator ArsR/SmtB family transcription factor [Chloroflexota bacterium]MCI0727903.1 metalloregulator ArsR/SmtB family transcription factor [Chloroflexota bacterium]
MTAPDPEFILTLPQNNLKVALEPAHNALNSLMLLNRTEKLSGLSDWVTTTAASLPAGRLHTNQLVFVGFFYVVTPQRSWPSFETYLDDLAAQEPAALRDRLLAIYTEPMPDMPGVTADPQELLADPAFFVSYLQRRFSEVDPELEREAHALLNDPPAMQDLIVSHLRRMWDDLLAAEWARVRPMLQASVEAFQQMDYSSLTTLEAARLITNQELSGWWKSSLEKTGRVILVPSAHIGPYLSKFAAGETMWLIFGARLPQGSGLQAPDLSRSELLVRLNALADDTRLRILVLLREQGELCAPDIIERLGLSQSAASRHLQQLSATGYVAERRREGAKCYRLNPARIEETLRTIADFLLG